MSPIKENSKSSTVTVTGAGGINFASGSIIGTLAVKPDRTSILDDAKIAVHGDRQSTYGHPLEDFTCVARMWSAYIEKKYGMGFSLSANDVPNMMIMVKLARLAQTPDHRDSKVDIAGYAETADMVDFKLKNPL